MQKTPWLSSNLGAQVLTTQDFALTPGEKRITKFLPMFFPFGVVVRFRSDAEDAVAQLEPPRSSVHLANDHRPPVRGPLIISLDTCI